MEAVSFSEGQRKAGAEVTTETAVIWAQRAELTALTKALIMGKGLAASIYMDSRYAFTTAHVLFTRREGS